MVHTSFDSLVKLGWEEVKKQLYAQNIPGESPDGLMDELLGLRISEVEASLCETLSQNRDPGALHPLGCERDWVGFPASTFLTPYLELMQMVELANLPSHSHWIDLGAGYGRLGWILQLLGRQYSFIGFELLAARVAEANRCFQNARLPHLLLVQQNLAASDFRVPPADGYLIYDYGSPEAIRKTLEDLKYVLMTAPRSTPRIVIGRGGLVRNWIARAHPWLEIKSDPITQKDLHFPNFSVYQF